MQRKLPLAVSAAVLTALATALTLLPQSAQAAVNRYQIQPDSPKPAACDNHGTIPAGTWLQNKPCGYFIGTAMAGSAFDVHETTPSDYHYGRNYGANNLCAWIPPAALSGSPSGSADPSCGAETRERISHRKSFGLDFNAGAHDATDGSPISVDPACAGGAYYNYYNKSDYSDGALRDPAGTPSGEVSYRFTTRGSNPAMVVRDTNLGWVFMDRDCVTDWRGLSFNNEDD